MAYYAPGNLGNIQDNTFIAKYTNAAINSRFKGMNVLTTLDALPMTSGFEAYSSYALTGYKWGGTQINYVALGDLKRNINNCSSVTRASTSGTTFTNALAYPKVYYVMFQAAGGKGGTRSSGTGTGGGSGYYTINKVVLQPGSSFKVTHSSTKATVKMLTGKGTIRGFSFVAGNTTEITASAGTAGGPNKAGVGFRSGGEEERGGGRIEANSLSCDGYACPAYAIAGGLPGQDRVSYSSSIESGRGGGGGGASAGRFLRSEGVIVRTGGDGAFYYKDTYHTYSRPALEGISGGGGGGGESPLGGAAGGAAESIVFY